MVSNKGFRSLSSSPLSTNNDTSMTQLPVNLLEAFIPGYSIISRFLLEVLGFDITLVVSVCFLVFALGTSGRYLGKHAYDWFQKFFMSSITIESDDDIHDHVMTWIADQQMSRDSRSLTAKTGVENAWDDGVDDEDMENEATDSFLNFSNWDAKIPPRYQPYFGRHRFRHRGSYFEFTREAKQISYGGSQVFSTEETIKLTCIGRSTQPIKDLIRECRDRHLDREKSRTVVRRPATKEMRNRGRNVWMKVATRPSRPLETVVLEPKQKQTVLADINEYLHPAAPRWYANRGIPYRRGYLFHGPPGTGKTSLSFAIAGVFGLDIYCISLLEPTLTEEDLGLLFNNLPRRCVVLLEDIDTAGLVQRDEEIKEEKAKKSDPAQISAEIAKAFKFVHERNDRNKNNNQGISLSGLLNAIDGVASHEGRVLVMTTNFPEKLDDALIRPGRIDMKVAFTMATRSQIKELFIRMYSPDESSPTRLSKVDIATNGKPANGQIPTSKESDGLLTPPRSPRNVINMSLEELEDIAENFAERLPEDTFTPAEIQGFLLTRKKEPKRALKEVEGWRDTTLKAKEAKSKLAPIQ